MPQLKLLRLAETEVHRIVEQLPKSVRAAAEECYVSYEDIHDDSDSSKDLMGLFEGLNRMDPEPGTPEDMPLIRLFLDNIYDYAESDEQEFCREVRITYLHELGHYLGWDEEQVEALGL